MKKILLAVFALASIGTAYAEAELKQVCHDKLDKAGKPVLDKKTGKTAQDCKTIKVHKKLEGDDKVPTKK
jgi:hypothetical protein